MESEALTPVVSETPATVTPRAGQLSVTVSVTAVGNPDEAEALAKAVLAATRVLVPNAQLG